MFNLSRPLVVVFLLASFLLAPLLSLNAQETRDRRTGSTNQDEEKRAWPSGTEPIVRAPGEATGVARLTTEPVMRIALSTDSGAATISTTGHLLKASELDPQPQPLDTARVRVESHLL